MPLLVWESRPPTGGPAVLFPARSRYLRQGLPSCQAAPYRKAETILHLQQSTSVAWVHPVGQQRSAVVPEQAVMGTWVQATLQWAASPVSRSIVQRSPSSGQLVGQLSGGSQ